MVTVKTNLNFLDAVEFKQLNTNAAFPVYNQSPATQNGASSEYVDQYYFWTIKLTLLGLNENFVRFI